MRAELLAFTDELIKIAAKVPVFHASAKLKKVLTGRSGASTFKSDPNDSRLYVAMRSRRRRGPTVAFGRQQRDRFGGDGVYLHHAKADTKKGWRPRLTPEAQKAGHTVEDLHDLVEGLDDPKSTRKSRGPLWKTLNALSGTWINTKDPSASLKATKVRKVME